MNATNNTSLNVFIDTNVLISAVLSEHSVSHQLIEFVMTNHHLIICSYSIEEASRVIHKRFPLKEKLWDIYINRMRFEQINTPLNPENFDAPDIRDKYDLPILVSAIIAQPDIFVSGDKDFHTEEIKEHLVVYTPADFLRDFKWQ